MEPQFAAPPSSFIETSSSVRRGPGRAIGAVLLSIGATLIIGLSLLVLTTGQTNWELTLDPTGPQSVCDSNVVCVVTWKALSANVGSLGYSNLNFGTSLPLICATVDSKGNQEPVSDITTINDINHSSALILYNQGKCQNTIAANGLNFQTTIAYYTIAFICAILGVVLFLHATERGLALHAVALLFSLAFTFSWLPTESTALRIFGVLEGGVASYIAPTLLATLIWNLLAPTWAPWFRRLSFALLIILALIFSSSLAMAATINSIDLYQLNATLGNGFILIDVLVILVIVVASNIRPSNQRIRDSARTLGVGIFIALVPFLALSLLPYFQGNVGGAYGAIGTVALVAIPLALAFAVYKRDLLRADSLVRISTTQGIWLIMVAMLAIVGITAASSIFSLPLEDAVLLFGVVFVSSIVAPSLRRLSRYITEAGFFPEIRHYRDILNQATAVRVIDDARSIADVLAGEIRLALPIRQLAVLIYDEESGTYVSITELKTAPLSEQHPLLEALAARSNGVVANDLPAMRYAALPQDVPPSAIAAWQLVLPITIGDRILGLVFLGPRDDGIGYSTTDREQLSKIVNQRAIGLDYGRLVGELKESLEEQRRIDGLKDQFIVTAHHELRTPLTGLIGYVEIMNRMDPKDWPEAAADIRWCIDNALRSGDDLLRLLENLLAADRASVRQTVPNPAEVDISPRLQQIVREIGGTVENRGRVIQLECPPNLRGWVDPQILAQIVTNLISNALKYSPVTAPVRVAAQARPEDGTFELQVQDWGNGIDPLMQEVIFEKFVRLERDLNSPIRGTGLGLAIVRDRVRASRGQVWVESRGVPGEGSIFHVTLPLTPEALDLADTQPRPVIRVSR